MRFCESLICSVAYRRVERVVKFRVPDRFVSVARFGEELAELRNHCICRSNGAELAARVRVKRGDIHVFCPARLKHLLHELSGLHAEIFRNGEPDDTCVRIGGFDLFISRFHEREIAFCAHDAVWFIEELVVADFPFCVRRNIADVCAPEFERRKKDASFDRTPVVRSVFGFLAERVEPVRPFFAPPVNLIRFGTQEVDASETCKRFDSVTPHEVDSAVEMREIQFPAFFFEQTPCGAFVSAVMFAEHPASHLCEKLQAPFDGRVEGEITVGFVFRKSAAVESSVQTDAEILVEVEFGRCVLSDYCDASGENRVFRNAGEGGVERVAAVFQRNRRVKFADFSRRKLDGDFCLANIFSRGVVHCGNGHGSFERFWGEVRGFRGDRNGGGGFGDNQIIRSGNCDLNAVVRSRFCFEKLKGIKREIRNGVLLLILSGQEQMREPVGAAG